MWGSLSLPLTLPAGRPWGSMAPDCRKVEHFKAPLLPAPGPVGLRSRSVVRPNGDVTCLLSLEHKTEAGQEFFMPGTSFSASCVSVLAWHHCCRHPCAVCFSTCCGVEHSMEIIPGNTRPKSNSCQCRETIHRISCPLLCPTGLASIK